MNKQLCISIQIVGALLVSSCNRDPQIIPPEPPFSIQTLVNSGQLVPPDTFCFRDPFPRQPNIGFQRTFDTVLYSLLSVNPNDPLEVAYLKEMYPGNGRYSAESWSLNLRTKEKYLLSPYKIFDLDWGKNGWILFTYLSPTDGDGIYKIKANGDSLIRLSEPSYSYSVPQWNQDESMIYFETSKYQPINLAKMTPDGLSIGSIQLGPKAYELETLNKFGDFYWSPNDSLMLIKYGSVFYMNSNTGDTTEVITLQDAYNSNFFQWSNDMTYIYWNNNTGVYKTTLSTRYTETTILGMPCNHIRYGRFYLPENNEWAYLTVHLVTPIGGSNLFVDSEIRMVDINTGEHWVVNLE